MQNRELASKVKQLRKRKGYSQEYLAEESGISLRTVQRIEKGENTPRGDTLKRLAGSLDVSPDEIIDWELQDDHNYLKNTQLSALGFLIFPLLGIIIPLAMWLAKKDKITSINSTTKSLINFEITWNLLVLVAFLFLPVYTSLKIHLTHVVVAPADELYLIRNLLILLLYGLNVALIIRNSIQIRKGKRRLFYPSIAFLK